MTLPVLQNPAQLRRGASSVSTPVTGSTLIKMTPTLDTVRVWVDGQHRLDYDMPLEYRDAFLTEAFIKLLDWQRKQGLDLAPWDKRLKPPTQSEVYGPKWTRFRGD